MLFHWLSAQPRSGINDQRYSDGSCNYHLLLLFVAPCVFVHFWSLCGETMAHVHVAPGGMGRAGCGCLKGLEIFSAWKHFGHLQRFKNTFTYCTGKGILLKMKQWNNYVLTQYNYKLLTTILFMGPKSSWYGIKCWVTSVSESI